MALTITLTVPDAYVPRAASTFGKILRLGRDCTQAEFKAHIVQYVTQQVATQENQDRFVAAQSAASDPVVVT